MSSGFGLPYRPEKDYVRFAAGNDADFEDEGLEPPLVRERRTCQNNVFLDADQFNQENFDVNTGAWNIGQTGPDITLSSTGAKTKLGKTIYAPRIKRMTPNFIQLGYYTACVNPRNNTLTFRIVEDPLTNYTATIANYNYTRIINTGDPEAMNTLANCQVAPDENTLYHPLPNAIYPGLGDPRDGIINWILYALNTAKKDNGDLYNPAVNGIWGFFSTNGYLDVNGNLVNILPIQESNLQWGTRVNFGYFYRSLSGSRDIFRPFAFTGGKIFDCGLHLLGLRPVPRALKLNPELDALYQFIYKVGPVEMIYTRYLDICSTAITQFSKLTNAGTGVQANLITRLYFDQKENGVRNFILDGFQQQVINMRKDYQLSNVDIFILDEYGRRVDIPQEDANAFYISLGLLGQL